MGKMKRGLLVTVEGPMHEVRYEDYRDIQRIIGCKCFASLPWVFDDAPACYIDDEGKLNGSLPNRAVYMDGACVDVVFGNMLFCGLDSETGESVDISDEEVARVRARFGQGNEGPGSGESAFVRFMLDVEVENAKGELKRHGKFV